MGMNTKSNISVTAWVMFGCTITVPEAVGLPGAVGRS
ncbi:Prokaryotic membrane lipoprotein lipid attachment site profile [Propionibacterium ruminifibrarum]|uniref:Prokaryotic membrane lipoprotein lipid attachment site profile n=1 Tax=Propionibacterium ruminifibrarum TaxID=1962131 RepID=A0A375I012_9ACTN|nr:Prokaryotic membrane lipoprotein lipid attachment site profile [Propionibacterium ruminifibrarum]